MRLVDALAPTLAMTDDEAGSMIGAGSPIHGAQRQRADRLQEYEYHRSPGISNEEAAKRAWERLQRDRQ